METSDAADVTDAYLRACLDQAGRLGRLVDSVQVTGPLLETAGRRLFPRPIFVDRAQVDAFATDVIEVFNLIVSLPRRLFGDDLFAYCAAIQLPPSFVPPLLRGYGRVPVPMYGRADMYHDGTAFQLLEFNIDSEIGGVDKAGELARLFHETEAFRTFATGRDLSFSQPAERLAEALQEAATPFAGGREPIVGLLQLREPIADDEDYHSRRSLQQVMRRLGMDFRYGAVSEAQERDGRLYLHGGPLDVVVRGFSAFQIVTEPQGWRRTEPVFRVQEQGGLAMWTPLYSQLFSNKGCLALLSDPAYHDRFTDDELSVIDRVVPWTRALDQGTDPVLVAQWQDRREELMIKPNNLYGGIGIVPGWQRDDREWAEALRSSAQLGAVVQERIVPRPEPVVNPTTGDIEQWHAAWGMFVMPAGYAGLYARLLPSDASAVIGLNANAETRLACAFTVGGATGDQP